MKRFLKYEWRGSYIIFLEGREEGVAYCVNEADADLILSATSPCTCRPLHPGKRKCVLLKRDPECPQHGTTKNRGK